MNRIFSLCAAFALIGLASPLAAQQLPGDSSAQSVPPAPPPDRPATSQALPPFPPMPSRAPQHRWVDMGRHHSVRSIHRAAPTHHRSTAARAKSGKAHPRLTRTDKNQRYCDRLSHRRMMHNRTCVALMKKQKASEAHQRPTRADKNQRYCDSLSHKRMMHNRTCVVLMKKQKASEARPTREDKNQRYCDSLNHRRAMHNRMCVALIKKELAQEASKSSARKAVTRHDRKKSRHRR